jgi:hypothetical protein
MASLTRVAPELPVSDMGEALQHYEEQFHANANSMSGWHA